MDNLITRVPLTMSEIEAKSLKSTDAEIRAIYYYMLGYMNYDKKFLKGLNCAFEAIECRRLPI